MNKCLKAKSHPSMGSRGICIPGSQHLRLMTLNRSWNFSNPQGLDISWHFRVLISLTYQTRASSFKHACLFPGGLGHACRWTPVTGMDMNPWMRLVGGIFSICKARSWRQCPEVEKLWQANIKLLKKSFLNSGISRVSPLGPKGLLHF